MATHQHDPDSQMTDVTSETGEGNTDFPVIISTHENGSAAADNYFEQDHSDDDTQEYNNSENWEAEEYQAEWGSDWGPEDDDDDDDDDDNFMYSDWAGPAHSDDGEQFEFQYITEFKHPVDPQQQSTLFSLPEELLRKIYTYVFTDYETDNMYDFDTCYRRPGYYAPRKTDAKFLETCQMVYRGAWFMPWSLSRHTLYLAWQNRRPEHSTSLKALRKCTEYINGIQEGFEIGTVQIFAQLCNLGGAREIMALDKFNPREVIITIRHTDFWGWESDSDLAFDIGAIIDVEFPKSVKRLVIELESLVRKKEAVEYMINQLSNYQFLRKDGGSFQAGEITGEVWEGSSTWENSRWLRDEDDAKPGRLEYYVGKRVFTPSMKDREASFGSHIRVTVSDEINERVRYKGSLRASSRDVGCLTCLPGLEGGQHHEVPASKIIEMLNAPSDEHEGIEAS